MDTMKTPDYAQLQNDHQLKKLEAFLNRYSQATDQTTWKNSSATKQEMHSNP